MYPKSENDWVLTRFFPSVIVEFYIEVGINLKVDCSLRTTGSSPAHSPWAKLCHI